MNDDNRLEFPLTPEEEAAATLAASSANEKSAAALGEESSHIPPEAEQQAMPKAPKVNAVKWPIKTDFDEEDDEEDEPLQAIFDSNVCNVQIEADGAASSLEEEAADAYNEAASLIEEEALDADGSDASFSEEEAVCAANSAHKVSEYDILELLQYLKDALVFLPEDAQEEYRKSDERMILECLMRKLAGKPGLRTHAAALQEKSGSAESASPSLSETFSLLANLSASLPDKDFASILGKHVEAVQERLAKLEEESR